MYLFLVYYDVVIWGYGYSFEVNVELYFLLVIVVDEYFLYKEVIVCDVWVSVGYRVW